MLLVFLLSLASCACMTGLIWLVQLLHYPAFAVIENPKFTTFHAEHTRRITYLVGPLMGIEFLSALGLLYLNARESLLQVNFLLLLLTFISTAALSVPLHSQLAAGKDC